MRTFAAALGAAGTLGVAAAVVRPPSAGAADAGGAALQLLPRSTFWVGPGENLVVRFALPPSLAAAGTAAHLGVTVTLYHAILNRSTFDETLRGTTTGGILSDPGTVVPLSGLANGDGYKLPVSVTAGGTTSPGGDVDLDLGCDTQPCGDVFPLRLQVVPLSGGSLPGGDPTLLTHLVYVDPGAVREPLRFAWEVPLALPPRAAGRDGTIPAPDTTAMTALARLASALAARPTVALTVTPGASTLTTLANGASGTSVGGKGGTAPSPRRAAARQVLSALQQVSAPADHETLAGTFVPVDGTAMVDGGLGGELSRQVARGRKEVAGAKPATVSDSTWVSSGPIDQTTVGALTSLGFDHFVVPAASVAPQPCDQTTCTQTFTLGSGSSGPSGVVSDPGLSAEMLSGTGDDAVLAAHQLLADLALVYYEAPNASVDGSPAVRGLALDVPPGTHLDPQFVSTLLDGLGGDPATGQQPDPLVEPVTLDQFFAQVGLGTLGDQPGNRAPVGVDSATLPVRALRAARAAWQAFAGAVHGLPAVDTVDALDQTLLTAESSELARPPALTRAQQAGVAGFHAALRAQVDLLSLPHAATIRLASSTARVPITVASRAPYEVTARLTVSSDKLVFGSTPGCVPTRPTAGGSTEVVCQMDLTRSSNTVYVEMRSRVSGGFQVAVDLATPDGHLGLVGGSLDVRSMSDSALAIALSLGAVAVLLTWWGRTVWRGRRSRSTEAAPGGPGRRRRRRGAHAVGASGRSG